MQKTDKIKNFFNGSIKLITPKIHIDNRGYFTESYNLNFYKKHYQIKEKFVQDNISFSKKKSTIRGMHLQISPFEQSKLIYVIHGSILDYFIDLRKHSKTFGKYGSVRLESKKKQFCSNKFRNSLKNFFKRNTSKKEKN